MTHDTVLLVNFFITNAEVSKGLTWSRTVRLLTMLALTWLAPVSAQQAATIEQLLGEPPASLAPGQAANDARRQFEAGEYAAAVVLAQAAVDEIEETVSRYDPGLLDPLTVLGDAQLALEDAEGALQAYERALFIRRINDGLNTPEQLDIVYRQAEAFNLKGDSEGANHRFEYAYQIMRRMHGEQDPRILPALLRLARWYEDMSFPLAARELYEYGMQVANIDESAPDRLQVELLRRFAQTYRIQAFPTRTFTAEEARPFTPKPTGAKLHYPPNRMFGQPIPFNRWVAAERALMKAVELTSKLADGTELETADALIDLADWWLMFKERDKAFDAYARVWAQLAEDFPAELQERLGAPVLLYMRNPGTPDPMRYDRGDRDPRPGRAEYTVSVNSNGEVRDIQTIRTDPEDFDYIRFRKTLTRARYRPGFVDGKPTAAEDVPVVFDFAY